MNKPNRTTIKNTAIVTTGVVTAFAAYRLGLQEGVKHYSLITDLTAHQMIMHQMRTTNPELVDEAVKTVIGNVEGLLKAAN